MKAGIQKRLAALEGRGGQPMYSVTLADGRTVRMTAIGLLMHQLDCEAGLPVPGIMEQHYLRGDTMAYRAIVTLVEA